MLWGDGIGWRGTCLVWAFKSSHLGTSDPKSVIALHDRISRKSSHTCQIFFGAISLCPCYVPCSAHLDLHPTFCPPSSNLIAAAAERFSCEARESTRVYSSFHSCACCSGKQIAHHGWDKRVQREANIPHHTTVR